MVQMVLSLYDSTECTPMGHMTLSFNCGLVEVDSISPTANLDHKAEEYGDWVTNPGDSPYFINPKDLYLFASAVIAYYDSQPRLDFDCVNPGDINAFEKTFNTK